VSLQISTPKSGGKKLTATVRLLGAAFFGVFFAMGTAFGYGFVGRPIARMVGARDWMNVPCQILSSAVRAHSSSDGTSSSVAVRYRYEVDGRSYVGDRYKFMAGSSSGRRGKAAIVSRLAPGTSAECWVDPAHPAESVIERGPTADLWFGLIPLVFMVVGGAGIWAMAVGKTPTALSARANTNSVTFSPRSRRAEPTILRPKLGRKATFVGLTLAALFWNGVVSVFIADIASKGLNGFNVVLSLFLLPFVAVGLLLIGLVARQGMKLVNPIPILTVNTPTVALGDELKVTWAIDGRVEKLTRLSIDLVGREEATYRRGTDTVTDTEEFVALRVAEQLPPEITPAGSARVTVPADTMHSFTASNNKVNWILRVRGEIPSWPDSEDVFPVTVTPRGR
jgi:hypothetical protein